VRGAGRRPNLWRQRSFQIFWTGETVSRLGSSVTVVLLPLTAVRVLHAGAIPVSLITAATWLPWLLIGLPAGALVDRLQVRRVMLGCDLVSIVAMASVPAAACAGVLSIGQVLAAALIGGVCSVLFRTAYSVYLPTFVERPDLAEANAKLSGAMAATEIGGPGIGGVIAQLFGAATGMLADAVSFAVSFVCLTRMPAVERHRRGTPKTAKGLIAETGDGLRFLFHDPLLRPMAIFSAVGNFGFTGFEAILVLFLVRTLHLSSSAVGLTLAVMGVGGVMGAVIARPLARRFGSAQVTVRGLLIGLPFALLMPLAHNGISLLYLYVGDFIAAASVAAANVMIGTFVQSYVPHEMLGRASSANRTVANCGIPAGAASAGVLASVVGTRMAVFAFTACVAASALILLATPARRLRDFPAEPLPVRR
jgi:predicted MFS family arabinose efflux permease